MVKGVEQVSYTNPDLDNNYATPGNLGVQFIDDLITRKYLVNPPEPALGVEETEELGGEEIHCTFTYDDYGNCITKSDGINTWEYAYDYENRLLSITENGLITEQYIYNGDGQRIKKINADSTRIYIYSGINVLYEINMTTQMDAIYIYGPTGRIAKKVNDITEFYHTDHLGSTRLTTSETGSKVTEVQYKPFGEQINTTDERYTYNGKELDDNGLYYYGARYYNPDTGRFLTRDPLQGDKASTQTLNKYVYCLNNPLKYIDPTGAEEETAQQIVEDIFERMQNVSPEQLAEIQELLDSGEITAFVALGMILELLGYEFREKEKGIYEIWVDDDSVVTMRVDNSMSDWGSINPQGDITINVRKSGNLADVALTVLHEISHAVLKLHFGDVDYEHQIIYYVQYSYISAFERVGVEFSGSFKTHVKGEVLNRGTAGIEKISLYKIVEKWLRGWRRC
ncbi:MAG: RHS repeat-associated core domain-containing protein [Theionarchaea archaeon]|nr:RHS repeat-associated core domain-containing protein [Theionarchaea archaeon]